MYNISSMGITTGGQISFHGFRVRVIEVQGQRVMMPEGSKYPTSSTLRIWVVGTGIDSCAGFGYLHAYGHFKALKPKPSPEQVRCMSSIIQSVYLS